MATSTIKMPNHIVDENVTLPFTPSRDGLLFVTLRGVTSGRTYSLFTNTIPDLIDGYTVNQSYIEGCIYVKGGVQITQGASGNATIYSIKYVSL